ncbi:MAG: O-antigen ligase family protein [Desulfobulbaceae bacterium]|nr:O-antigen ligase family protein [Desulfobulbaceae bacterium]
MAKKRKNHHPYPKQQKKVAFPFVARLRCYDEPFFSGLLFCFFFLAPLPFISGFTPAGRIMFTLYDLPKYAFLCPAAFFIGFCFVFSLSYHQERWVRTINFLGNNTGLKLLLLFFALQTLSLTAALVWQNAVLQLLIYLSFIQLFIVLAVLFPQRHLLYASLYGTVLSLLIFCPLGILQFFKVQLPFLLPISGPASTLGYRNPAAHYLVLNLPFALYLAHHFWRDDKKKSHPGWRLFMVMFFASLSLVALAHTFMTTTRTAILALLLYSILLPVFYLFQRRKRQSLSLRVWITTGIATITVAILIIGSLAVFPRSRARVMSSVRKIGSLSILEARRYHWGNTLYMIKEHPWRGVGLGNWRFAYPLYMHRYARDSCFTFKVQVKKSHNDYLQIAAECGLGALFIFLCLWGRQFYLLWKNDRQLDVYAHYPLFCSLVAFSVIMMFSFPLQMGYSRMFFFYLLALGEGGQRGSKL